MSDVMIEARSLKKNYGLVQALKGVSFEVRKGQIVGLLGPNGAGKTTAMKILTCFIAPTDGTASVNGCDVFADPMGVRKAIGYLPESTPLYTEMLVLEYLDWIAQMRNISKPRERIKKVVEQTGLTEEIGKPIRALSKGLRQRVGLAQALVHEPPILILDEPMSGLDPNQASEIRDLIREIGKERTVILSTHNLAEVQVTCDRVLIIAKGTIVADDTAAALKARGGKARFYATVPRALADNRAMNALEAIVGVERVQQGTANDGDVEFEIVPTGTNDLRQDIFNAAVKGNFPLIGLRREGANLENVFRDLTIGNTGPAETPRGRANGGAPKSGDSSNETKPAAEDGAVQKENP